MFGCDILIRNGKFTMEKMRNQTIDALKGLAILIVMIGHVFSWNHMEDGYVYDAIKVVQMPLFFIVSGYLCGMGRKVTCFSAYGKILKKRAVAYLVPFFFWILLKHPLTPVSSIKLTLFKLDEGLWYLMTLFILTVMVYTAQLTAAYAGQGFLPDTWRYRRKTAAFLSFWGVYAVMAAAVVVQSFTGWTFLSPGLTRLYLPFYMTGYVAGEYREQVARVPEKVKAALAIVTGAGWLVLIAATDLLDVSTLLQLGRQMLASFLGCYTVIYLLSLCRDGKGKRFLAWLGNYTLEIYVLHFHFATLLNPGKTFTLYSLEGVLFVLASFVVMSAITAAIIWVTKKVWILDFLLYGKLKVKERK